MLMNNTPNANRVHIGIFGKRNAGKSSLINALTGQELAIVSDVKGTTTDPVFKAMELLPLGPVVLIDTPGIDDMGELGEMRVKQAYKALNRCNLVILVSQGLTKEDEAFINILREREVPYISVYNKADLAETRQEGFVYVSTKTGEGINELKELIAKTAKSDDENPIINDLLTKEDVVVLVCPIDEAAPKGRIILPQQQVLREILDIHAKAVVIQDCEVSETLKILNKKPRFIITDSQAFASVSKQVPCDIPLTSFSILLARKRGWLKTASEGVKAVENLKDGDFVLISEGCTHHRQCNDIGTVKIPALLKKKTGKELNFDFTQGHSYNEDLSKYKLIVHCGGCMITNPEIKYRMRIAKEQNIPFTNYGILLAYLNGILDKTLPKELL
ncbi:MAG: [FeFe] hydrogenase H-cluster maturation GTPase HydF [Clostridia bacterium]|nr:[FeFe] hydrogenase H-cluster maturation GTPase HydF [Clostridia bacterium]